MKVYPYNIEETFVTMRLFNNLTGIDRGILDRDVNLYGDVKWDDFVEILTEKYGFKLAREISDSDRPSAQFVFYHSKHCVMIEVEPNTNAEAFEKRGEDFKKYKKKVKNGEEAELPEVVISHEMESCCSLYCIYTESYGGKELVENVVQWCRENRTHRSDFLPKKEKSDSVYTLAETGYGLALSRHEMETTSYGKEIIENNYNDDFKPAYDKIIDFLGQEDECGLVMLNGDPGTGKSSFLLHISSLADELDKKIVFVPVSSTPILAEPSFMTFAVNQLQNSILIIEDAEDALRARDDFSGSAVTNILNMTDGILGKVLKLKVIATINTSDKIDSALSRKGRMKAKYTFKNLEIDKANDLLKKLGIDKTVDKPTSLANLYNLDENVDFDENKPKKGKIGF